ncbi:hypothetical protein HC031_23895 [Planosporangium thailandense]|uniref:DUF5132 domain-containing protein n=1 Tax=Planosporangium thailandense TaxID=765197 RepID=A0ABX0Y3Y8_9ACTN|nr:hypothetical protein [Planosporangium thailandense]NJC72738.1 hypothetical protein [Planosporangium thailandense]
MRRLLWLGVGLAVGALVVRAVNKKMQALTPASLAGTVQQSAVGLLDEVRSFVEDVRSAAAEREAEIHEAFSAGALFDEYDAEGNQD